MMEPGVHTSTKYSRHVEVYFGQILILESIAREESILHLWRFSLQHL